MFKKIIIAFGILVSLNSYAVPWEDFKKVDRGNTEADVLSKLGGPNARTYAGKCGSGIAFQWFYRASSGEKDVVITFCNGVVTGAEQKGFTK